MMVSARWSWPLVLAWILVIPGLPAQAPCAGGLASGLHRHSCLGFTPPEQPSGVAVLPDGRVITYDGARIIAWQPGGSTVVLHTPAGPLGVLVMAVDPTASELWFGPYAGELSRLPLAGGPATPVGLYSGLGWIAFSPTGEAHLSLLDLVSGTVVQVDPLSGATTVVVEEPGALSPPPFAFLPSGDLLVSLPEGPLGHRLHHFTAAQVTQALVSTPLLRADGAPWSEFVPSISAVVTEGGGAAIVVDGSNREVHRAAGMTLSLLATGAAPVSGGSSFMPVAALTPGWPAFEAGAGPGSGQLALLSLRYDAAFSYTDGAVTVLLTTPPGGFVCGDADVDGDIDIVDALLAAQQAAGLLTLGALEMQQADVDGSGSVDILDALRLAQAAVGIVTSLSC